MGAMVYFIIYYDQALERVFTNQAMTRPSLTLTLPSSLIWQNVCQFSIFIFKSQFFY